MKTADPISQCILQYGGIAGARLQYLQGDDESDGLPEPGVEEGVNQRVQEGV